MAAEEELEEELLWATVKGTAASKRAARATEDRTGADIGVTRKEGISGFDAVD